MAKRAEQERHPQVQALREGRKNRSARFASAKQYRRKPKHTNTHHHESQEK